jgi:ribosomal protein S18 acetylase RimI-like enzyme
MPRRSDELDQLFWLDDAGPVAAVVLTDWGDAWTCDPIVVPGVALPEIWPSALEAIDALGLETVEVLARDDDLELLGLLADAGFVPGDESSGITWLDADERPTVASVPEGFRLADRTSEPVGPHPLARRNGEAVEERLRQCSLYDPELDLTVRTTAGEVAGYALFWLDPVTGVGLVEPMRVEEPFQRRGLARALLTAGLDRLARRGARRLKVGYVTEPARRLYTGAGFHVTATSRSYRYAAKR